MRMILMLAVHETINATSLHIIVMFAQWAEVGINLFLMYVETLLRT